MKEKEENEEKKGKHVILEIQDSILGNRTQKASQEEGLNHGRDNVGKF